VKADKKNPIRFREITPYVDVVIDGFPWRAANPLPGIGWELQSKDRPYRNRILTSEEYATGDEKALTKDSSLLGSVHTRSVPSTQVIAPQSPPPSNTSAAMPGHQPVARPEAPAPLKRNRPKKDRS